MASTGSVCDTDTKLWLHNDATPFVDSSAGGRAITNTDVTLDTTNKKFGAGSAHFPSPSGLSIPNHADLIPGTADLTVDFQIYFNSIATGFEQQIISKGNSSLNNGNWGIYYYNGNIYFRAWNQHAFSWTPSLNTWYHVAMVKASGVHYGFVEGSALSKSGVAPNADLSGTEDILIGRDPAGNYGNFKLDELRIVVGTAVWTTDFTPPSAAYGLPTSIKKIGGVPYASIKKLGGVPIASVKKFTGVS